MSSVRLSRNTHDLQVKRTYIQLLIMNNRLDEAEKLTADVLKKSSQDAGL
jgi:hypothetical protein